MNSSYVSWLAPATLRCSLEQVDRRLAEVVMALRKQIGHRRTRR
jgi:hypothetical protein